MTEPQWLTPQERQAWLALVFTSTVLPATFDSQLLREGKLSLFSYNVLAMLSEAEGRTLPMSELAARTSSSLSRLSHVVRKLEDRGWVERKPSAMDARVTTACLTDDGMSTIESMAPGHVSTVRALIFDGLDEQDVADLERVGKKIVGRLAPNHWLLRDGE